LDVSPGETSEVKESGSMGKLQEDRVVLQAKFQNVDRLLQAYDDQILKLEAKLHTISITHADVPGEFLLQATKDAMISISEIGIDQSLIEDDLLRCQAELGTDFGPWQTSHRLCQSSGRI
jgi:hypothetical protein